MKSSPEKQNISFDFAILSSPSHTQKNVSLCGSAAKVHVCSLEVSEFDFQSLYYVYFRINALWKGMNPLLCRHSSYELNSIAAALLQG